MRSLWFGFVLFVAVLLASPRLAAEPVPGPGLELATDRAYIEALMQAQPERFAVALDSEQAKTHRIQILISFVDREAKADEQAPTAGIERHGFRVDAEYFYPASAVKIGAAVAAMQMLRALAAQGHRVDLDTPLTYHPLFDGDRLDNSDSSNLNGGHITARHLIRRTTIVSSNRAFNRLYELVGQHPLNQAMRAAGLENSYFLHRLSRWLTPEQNLRTPRIDIHARSGRVTIPVRTSEEPIRHHGIPGLNVAERYIDGPTGAEVAAPMSFATKNRMTLVDLQNMLIMIVRPDIADAALGLPGFGLHSRDRRVLMRAMREYPAESKNPLFTGDDLSAERFKHLLPGLLRVKKDDDFTIWSKAGKAYGFTIENAYVEDRKSRRGFFFTVAIYTNPNGRLNDNDYAYDDVGDPFIHDLAEVIARDFWR